MKKNQPCFILNSFVILTILAWNYSLHAAEVTIMAKVPQPKAEYSVYKMEGAPVNNKEIIARCANIAKVSGFKSFSREMMKPVEDRLAMLGDEIQLSMNTSGSEFFYSNFPALKLTEKTGRLYSDEEAIKLSHNYLKKAGLMPRYEQELKIDHVGGIMQMLSNGKSPEKKAVVVYFRRELDGIPVRNFGSSITVTLAESEIPVGVQYHWREVASRSKVSSRSFLNADEITQLIKEDINRVYAKDAKVTVDTVALVLYDNGGDYIQPAYLYEGISKSSVRGVSDMPVLGYVAALKKVYEPIHHPAYSAELKTPTVRIEKPSHDKDE
ncbi:MAG: hypothetical protein KJ804_14245 [Proteobacteria bacterium]|nr:hypothetical protein [Pseudomonadota bacterium]MBU1059470.1 hypothetical protein [Pseudomonadota bacterium]